MNRRLILTFGSTALMVLMARAAVGQEVTIGYQGLPYKYTGDSGNTGIQVSDGVLMHVGAGAEAGYDSNVFFSDTDAIGAGVLRVSAYAEITNATRTGALPSGLSFDARAGLAYRRYLSDNSAVSPYENAFMPSAGLSLSTSASPSVSFGFADTFVRTEDPPYTSGQVAITRDNNQASADVRWAPGGGRINLLLRYTNMVDVFETASYSYANSLTQELMVDGSWKWLPKTALFFQVRQGIITYLQENASVGTANSPPKYPSYPLRAMVGLRGLITERISTLVAVGYARAFYSCAAGAVACVTTGGFAGSTYANLELTFRPTVISRVVLGYRHDFQNSVISTFYYNDQVYASYVQQIAGRFALDLSGRYQRRDYQGFIMQIPGMPLQPRTDDVFQVGATFDYFLRNWAYAGVGYSLLANSSNTQLMVAGTVNSLDYVKHQVFARVGLTY